MDPCPSLSAWWHIYTQESRFLEDVPLVMGPDFRHLKLLINVSVFPGELDTSILPQVAPHCNDLVSKLETILNDEAEES